MSEDDEYDEDLPPISVNSSTRNSGMLSMPSAEELASQRAREAECERELQTLREQHEVTLLTDSSSSEGEAALAAAVGALLMGGDRGQPEPTPSRLPPPLQMVLDHLAPPALSEAPSVAFRNLTDDVCQCVEAGCVRTDEEVAFAVAWLCVTGAGEGEGARAGGARKARRSLYLLLDSEAARRIGEEAFQKLTTVLVGMESPADLRLEMADVLAGVPDGAGEPRQRLQFSLLSASLAADLGLPMPHHAGEERCACAWAGGAASSPALWAGATEAGARGARAIRAVGHLLRACPAPPRCAEPSRRLLAALAPPTVPAHAKPAALEMLVNAAKLQLLFRE